MSDQIKLVENYCSYLLNWSDTNGVGTLTLYYLPEMSVSMRKQLKHRLGNAPYVKSYEEGSDKLTITLVTAFTSSKRERVENSTIDLVKRYTLHLIGKPAGSSRQQRSGARSSFVRDGRHTTMGKHSRLAFGH